MFNEYIQNLIDDTITETSSSGYSGKHVVGVSQHVKRIDVTLLGSLEFGRSVKINIITSDAIKFKLDQNKKANFGPFQIFISHIVFDDPVKTPYYTKRYQKENEYIDGNFVKSIDVRFLSEIDVGAYLEFNIPVFYKDCVFENAPLTLIQGSEGCMFMGECINLFAQLKQSSKLATSNYIVPPSTNHNFYLPFNKPIKILFPHNNNTDEWKLDYE